MSFYMSILGTHSPLPIGVDSNSRERYSFNLEAQVAAPSVEFELELEKLIVDATLIAANSALIGRLSVVPTGDGPFVSIMDTGGSSYEQAHDQKVTIEHLSAQILVRGADDRATRTLAISIARELHGTFNTTVTV